MLKNPLFLGISGKMPRKVYNLERKQPVLKPVTLPASMLIFHSLQRVLRLPSVASKRYLTNKVDRCVTGLIPQQQCVGPLHTPLADVAVTALSHFGFVSIKRNKSFFGIIIIVQFLSGQVQKQTSRKCSSLLETGLYVK